MTGILFLILDQNKTRIQIRPKFDPTKTIGLRHIYAFQPFTSSFMSMSSLTSIQGREYISCESFLTYNLWSNCIRLFISKSYRFWCFRLRPAVVRPILVRPKFVRDEESENGSDGLNEISATSRLVDAQYTIDDIVALADTTELRVSPLKMPRWNCWAYRMPWSLEQHQQLD